MLAALRSAAAFALLALLALPASAQAGDEALKAGSGLDFREDSGAGNRSTGETTALGHFSASRSRFGRKAVTQATVVPLAMISLQPDFESRFWFETKMDYNKCMRRHGPAAAGGGAFVGTFLGGLIGGFVGSAVASPTVAGAIAGGAGGAVVGAAGGAIIGGVSGTALAAAMCGASSFVRSHLADD